MKNMNRTYKLSFRKLLAFTLAEMMVVMLVLSIVLAASMPLITKKTSLEGSGSGIWKYVPTDKTHIFYGLTKGNSAMIGTKTPPDKTTAPKSYNAKLYINIPDTEDSATYPHMAFGVNGEPKSLYSVTKDQGIAQGAETTSTGTSSIAIGNGTSATNNYSIAMGTEAKATGLYSTAIGYKANAAHEYSTAIGWDTTSPRRGFITIGKEKLPDGTNQVVYIPGRLILGSVHNNKSIYVNKTTGVVNISSADGYVLSDKRVKHVIEDYKSSLDNIKQLRVYRYNFDEKQMVEKYKKELWADKSDSILCPDGRPAQFKKCVNQRAEAYRKDAKKRGEFSKSHVGIIAQDLEKVFPDSVKKDKNGYMQIETNEIFYAMINAIQELDNKIQNTQSFAKFGEIQNAFQNELQEIKKSYVTREEYDKKMEILKMHLYVFKNYVDKNIKEKVKLLEKLYSDMKRDFEGMKKEMISLKDKLQKIEKQSREDNKKIMKRINNLEKENRELRRSIENLERKVK